MSGLRQPRDEPTTIRPAGGPAAHPFLAAWRAWALERAGAGPPYLLSGDEALWPTAPDAAGRRHAVVHASWAAYAGRPEFGRGDNPDTRLDLSVLPTPFAGDFAGARVVLLLLNPALKPGDRFAQDYVPGVRERLLATLRQEVADDAHPFVYLDPAWSWHPAGVWWQVKLRAIIAAVAAARGTSFADARRHVARRIAALDMVPYHAERYALPDRIRDRLTSARLARAFARDVLARDAADGRRLIIVARQASAWGLAAGPNAVIYTGTEQWRAHLTVGTRGGQAMLAALAES